MEDYRDLDEQYQGKQDVPSAPAHIPVSSEKSSEKDREFDDYKPTPQEQKMLDELDPLSFQRPCRHGSIECVNRLLGVLCSPDSMIGKERFDFARHLVECYAEEKEYPIWKGGDRIVAAHLAPYTAALRQAREALKKNCFGHNEGDCAHCGREETTCEINASLAEIEKVME